MITSTYAASAYTKSKASAALTTEDPLDLILMLYDGGIDFLGKAASAIAASENMVKLKYLNRGFAIVEELHNSLNMKEGGELATKLNDLYQYMMRELVHANINNDAEKIKKVIDLLKNLRDGWTHTKKELKSNNTAKVTPAAASLSINTL